MKTTKSMIGFALLALLLVPAVVLAQEQPAERGSVELGVRQVWGDVTGRPDLPYSPSLTNSKLGEYTDIRNGVFLRGFNADFNDVLGSKNFLSVKSQNSLYRDQGYLATFGQYGKFNVQFRYDETPHTYTDTARTLFTQTAPGVYTFPYALRTTLQGTSAANIPATVNALVPSFGFLTPSIERKAGTGLVSYNLTENWSVNGSFSRENQAGSRPIGYVLNSSPSASASAGYGVELPEPIDYYTNNFKVGTEYAKEKWAVQAGYLGSFFHDKLNSVTFDNPFNTVNTVAAPNATTGVAALYPSNHAQNINFAGTYDLGKYAHIMGSISPGWMKQNENFLPYGSNSVLESQTSALPANSLDGSRRTLAMNYTAVSHPWKSLELTARYRHYDFKTETPTMSFTPIEGDMGAPNLASPVENTAYSYFKKTADLDATWFFTKKNSVKVGYEWEGFDRENRDVSRTNEHSIISTLDSNPRKDLQFRLSYRHSDRKPHEYENASEEMMPAARRFDENARLRDRADASVQYSPLQKLTLSASAGTVQDNYNLAANSLTGQAYSFLAGTGLPYYSYGLLKDISSNYNCGLDYAATKEASFFAEYTLEKYNTSMVSRQRNVNTVAGVEVFDAASDSPGNDWASSDRNIVDTYTTGVDLYLSKKVWVTTFYSLSAAKDNNLSTALGNAAMYAPGGKYYVPAVGAIPVSKFLVTTVMNFPETVSRLHEFGAVLKFKLTKNVMPKFEYRYDRFDNKDYQTSPMDQFMGISNPAGVNFYPYLNVFDASAARFLFLGADNPSYHAHRVSATLEYHF